MERGKNVKAPSERTLAELFSFRLLTERGPIAYDYTFQVLPAACLIHVTSH
jgi:hypothetical protein